MKIEDFYLKLRFRHPKSYDCFFFEATIGQTVVSVKYKIQPQKDTFSVKTEPYNKEIQEKTYSMESFFIEKAYNELGIFK
jgi:hypothetical protein